jgi:hypothetical protein
MQAFFSGRMDHDYVHIRLTHGEEVDFAGAFELLEELDDHDTVLVVDVTATPTRKDLVIEKCADPSMQFLLHSALDGMSYDMYEDCPDPVSDCDEVDVYSRNLERVCFIGVPCTGGDYNMGMVSCRKRSIDALSTAICRIADSYPDFCRELGLPVR